MNQNSAGTTATVQYLGNDEQLGAYFASVAGGTVGTYEGNYRKHVVDVTNGRLQVTPGSLDHQGFLLTSHQSQVSNFFDDTEISDLYEQEVKALVIKQTGAKEVEIFDHTRRAASEELRQQKKVREVASVIHNDYTAMSGPKRLREMFPEKAEKLANKRFAIVNVWRSINGSVENYPIAFCDAQTVAPKDLVAVARKSAERVGEIQLALYNPNHRWVYFPQLTMDEALLFKTYDSAEDGRTRFTIHTSFDDPQASFDARPRESMETRCFVFYDE